MARAVKKKNNASRTLRRDSKLTIPDLVVLSLLAERPMHGYDVNATLEERNIRDWASVSRPQVYYSLDKLLKLKLTRVAKDPDHAAGPERRVFETTVAGREGLAEALNATHWVEQKAYQPFLIWLALSWQARPGTFGRQLRARRALLSSRLAHEEETLADVLKAVGHPHHEAVWMLELFIEQIQTEMRWIEKLLMSESKRAPAGRGSEPRPNV